MEGQQNNKIIIKSPGKSLLSGGYLILDKSKRGLVINIDTYITCESFYLIKEKSKETEKNYLQFNIYSEYLNQNFNYLVSLDFNNENEIKIYEKEDKDNKWIKNCINLILTYEKIFSKKNYPNNIVIKNLDDNNIKAIILGSCLLSNNLSQNKIGSCFDIISSLFGSQIFKQTEQNIFLNSPFYLNSENISKINNLLEYLKSSYIPNILFLNENNKYLHNKIYFISIEIGSDTRILVKKVLEYANNKKKEKLYDDDLFSQLNELNEKIINTFLNDSNTNNSLIKELCIKYRTILRKISEESKVDIEPTILTPLLDDLIKLDNIIYAICPGAGGYDSIIIMAKEKINESELIKNINDIIDNFNSKNHDNKLNIKANLMDVNISIIPGTIIL